MKENIGTYVIGLISLFSLIVLVSMDPISQDIEYHDFSDSRTLIGIVNFWNVTSNLPFIFVGIIGLNSISKINNKQIVPDIKISYILFFIGVFLVGFGSGYYHMTPNNNSLLWDRLPMTIAFMALFSIVIGEFISVKISKILLWPLIFIGSCSVLYWNYTEGIGVGDLRWYVLVQFLPMLLIPIIIILYKSKFEKNDGFWILLLAYILAKVFEYFDSNIYDFLIVISGHSIKHIISAIGIYFLIIHIEERQLSS